jgi:hypothetical protein
MAEKEPYYLEVVGSRDFEDMELLTSILDDYIETLKEDYRVIIVSGGAKGADQLAEKYTKKKGLEISIFKPDWNLGNGGVPHSKQKIIRASHEVIAFWDGQSKGTKSSIDLAEKHEKPCTIIPVIASQSE